MADLRRSRGLEELERVREEQVPPEDGVRRRPAARTPIRDQTTEATRARIAETVVALFPSQGYASTTIDQIAVAAVVGRRTVFRHYATKEAILFDHLVVRRELAVARLQDRASDELVLVSLHAVLRELAGEGFDRHHLAQFRAVLATNPELVGEELTIGIRAFEKNDLHPALHIATADSHPYADR